MSNDPVVKPPFASIIYNWFWSSIDWVFPPDCIFCGEEGNSLCDACLNEINYVEGNVCRICGSSTVNKDLCLHCKKIQPYFTMLRSVAFYDGPIRKAIISLKYYRDMGIARVLSKLMLLKFQNLQWKIDVVIPVPLSQQRINERGYNQAGLLALPLAINIFSKYNDKALKKTRETLSQVGLNLIERQENVAKAFMADSNIVANKNILLIDDVTTSGSTINECAKALKNAGAKMVYAITLAKAKQVNDDFETTN